VDLRECARCGQTTTGEVCAFCKLADQVRRAGAPPAAPAPDGDDLPDPPPLRGLTSDLAGASEVHRG
jgi:hypothetical protein